MRKKVGVALLLFVFVIFATVSFAAQETPVSTQTKDATDVAKPLENENTAAEPMNEVVQGTGGAIKPTPMAEGHPETAESLLVS